MEKISVLDSFGKHFSNWFKGEALPHLVNYLVNEKKVTVTLDELSKIFELPSGPATPTTPAAFGSFMGLPTNGNISMVAAAKPPASPTTGGKGGRKKNQVDPNAPTCRYIFSKGQREGEACGAASVAYHFCIACIGRGESLSLLEKEGIPADIIRRIKDLKDSKKDLREFLTNPSSLGEMAAPNKPATPQTSPIIAPNFGQQPQFYPLPSNPLLFTIKELVPNAIFSRKSENDPHICRGKLDIKDGNATGPFPLSPEEIQLLQSRGLSYSAPGSVAAPGATANVQPQPQPPIIPPTPVAHYTQFATGVQQSNGFTPQSYGGPALGSPLQMTPSNTPPNQITPPSVIMPPYMANSQLGHIATSTIMDAMPNIIKNAIDQAPAQQATFHL